jgi:type I restriction enzyme, R subunit
MNATAASSATCTPRSPACSSAITSSVSPARRSLPRTQLTGGPLRRTTAQAFGDKLHTYTIVDAIPTRMCCRLRLIIFLPCAKPKNIEDKKVRDIDREAALAAPERLENIVRYIRDHFDQKTKRNSFYKLKDRRLAGFNSILAVSSIDVAKKYYAEFQKQLSDAPSDKKLKIALIYSFGVNEEEIDGVVDENSEDTSGLDKSSRDFLKYHQRL